MSLVRLAIVMSAGMMLAGLCARNAVSDDGAARDRGGDRVGQAGGLPPAADRDLPAAGDFHNLYAAGPPRDPGLPDDQWTPPGTERPRDAVPPPHDDRHQAGPPKGKGRLDAGPPNGKGGPDAGPPARNDHRQASPPKAKNRPGKDRSRQVGPPPHENLESLFAKDPEMLQLTKAEADLDRQTHQKAMEYRQAPPALHDKIRQQLEQLVDKQFEVRQQRRSHELKWLEDELQRLRGAIDHRTKARKAIVEKRVSDLLGLEDDVGF
jgi:hypothetical protein